MKDVISGQKRPSELIYQNIPVPVNSTEILERRSSTRSKWRRNAARSFTHSVPITERGYRPLSIESIERREKDLQNRAEEVTTDVADRVESQGFDAVSAVSSGDPADSKLAYTEERDIDLVVIGARKRSPTGKLLFGSVTQLIVLDTDILIVVVG